MLVSYFRITMYIPIEDADSMADSLVTNSKSVQPILRVLGNIEFAGAVGTYKAVTEISTGRLQRLPGLQVGCREYRLLSARQG